MMSAGSAAVVDNVIGDGDDGVFLPMPDGGNWY